MSKLFFVTPVLCSGRPLWVNFFYLPLLSIAPFLSRWYLALVWIHHSPLISNGHRTMHHCPSPDRVSLCSSEWQVATQDGTGEGREEEEEAFHRRRSEYFNSNLEAAGGMDYGSTNLNPLDQYTLDLGLPKKKFSNEEVVLGLWKIGNVSTCTQ